MAKLDNYINHKLRRKRRIKKMIFSIIIIVVGMLIIGLSVFNIIKIKTHDISEDDPLDTEIEMVDLSDIPDEPPLEQSLEEWASAKRTAEEEYEHDIQETFGRDLRHKLIDIELSEELQYFTQDICYEYEVSYPLILALMDTESSFSPAVGSEAILGGEEGGERYYGYMQLSLGNCNKAKEILGVDAHTPKGNIQMGVYLMSEYLKKGYDIPLAIMCYKGGEGAGLAWREKDYELPIVNEILYLQSKYRSQLNDEIDFWKESPNE